MADVIDDAKRKVDEAVREARDGVDGVVREAEAFLNDPGRKLDEAVREARRQVDETVREARQALGLEQESRQRQASEVAEGLRGTVPPTDATSEQVRRGNPAGTRKPWRE